MFRTSRMHALITTVGVVSEHLNADLKVSNHPVYFIQQANACEFTLITSLKQEGRRSIKIVVKKLHI